jgi:hypothetical protein
MHFYPEIKVIEHAGTTLGFLGARLAVNIPASCNYLPNGSACPLIEWQKRT